ncbi:phenylalanine--tRNA ligase subunit beta [Patescibacteria group bacterium]|nr:phenylalanine--tRNA ligase subunit beta [Patescibacteria group bacterium]
MKVSYDWLQTFFTDPLPVAGDLEEKLTFHSSEIEEVVEVDGDMVIDVKVLPDKSAWLLSHRGVAKEVGVILSRELCHDPLQASPELTPAVDQISLTLETPGCDYYSAALMTGVQVGPSPEWLQKRLKVIGQRPINNVVDVANYVMFEMGQPLHAFDADKLGRVGELYSVGVRAAKIDEKITTLMGEEVTLSPVDMVVVDGTDNSPIAIAGVKGGAQAAVDDGTTTLLIESAHFERVSVRKTAQRYSLRTDASQRYENGVPRALAPLGLKRVVELLAELVGGTLVGYTSTGEGREERASVSVTLAKINSVLGLSLTTVEVVDIMGRLGYQHVLTDGTLTITPPFERDDLVIAEDVIEEIGRFYGLTHIASIPPTGTRAAAINVRHYYAERIRGALTTLGFSEIFTSSFRENDEVRLKNALASDKSYLRSQLKANLTEALAKNAPNRDLLGLSAVQLFELGTVFEADAEYYHLAIAVRSGSEYKAKVDDVLLEKAKEAVVMALGVEVSWMSSEHGVAECRLSDLLATLPVPTVYEASSAPSGNRYQAFSLYPAVSRDLAVWMPEGTDVAALSATLRAAAGALCVRHTHIDTFTKEGRTSLAFRFVFQATDRTLTGEEVDSFVAAIALAAQAAGGEVR